MILQIKTFWLIRTSACWTTYILQAGTVQRSDQHKQQGIYYARRTSRNTGLYNDTTTPIIHTRRFSHSLHGQSPDNFYETPTPWQRLIDKTNDCVINSEHGALAKGSDPPCGHSAHTTAGDMWRAPARRLIKEHLPLVVEKTDNKKSRSPSDGKKITFFRFGRRGLDPTSNLSPPRP